MNETPSSVRRLRATVIATVATAIIAATLSLMSAGTATAATSGVSTAATSTLASCKATSVSSCRKVTARTCRVKAAKRARAQGKALAKKRVARSCAKKAKRHCATAAQKRRQAAAAKRCATPRSSASRSARAAVSTGVMPGASTTGVPAGTRLKVVRGDMTVTTSGTVLDGLDVRGWVTIKADNVTIKNSIIRGRAGGGTLVRNLNGGKNLVIENSSLIAMTENRDLAGIKGANFSVNRVEIAKVVDGIQVIGGNASIMNSWFHSNVHMADDRYKDGVSHDDSIQIEGGPNTTIQNNRIEGSNNAAIMVTQNHSRVESLTIVDNFIQHGACTINADEKGKGAMLGFTIASNKFGPSMKYGKTCPLWVPKNSAVSMSNNAWADNGTAIAVRFR